MRRPQPLAAGVVVILLALMGFSGCQKAGRYKAPAPDPTSSKTTSPSLSEALPPLDEGLVWQPPREGWKKGAIPIRFVHVDKAPQEWAQLPLQWNPAIRVEQVGALAGFPASTMPWILADKNNPAIRIKVPLGLDDPTDHIPPASPLTLSRWELGKRIFFDTTLLNRSLDQSCASCHVPQFGFTDQVRGHNGFNTPTLLGCVYNSYQFWDGRARYLEEIVQRSLEDEREPASPGPFRHVWHGVIGRLQQSASYRLQFRGTFGTEPTQDALGKAVAAYLRTLLSGDSLYDRASHLAKQAGKTPLEPVHFEQALTEADLRLLGKPARDKKATARELHHGYRLFFDREPNRTLSCTRCHTGNSFSDGRFHNLSVGPIAEAWHNAGRFAHVPIGLKSSTLIGAYKTPTLRSLARTAPYLHTGEEDTLEGAIKVHDREDHWNPYLDPLFLDPVNPSRRLPIGLTDTEVKAVILFLRSLNGKNPSSVIASPPDLGP